MEHAIMPAGFQPRKRGRRPTYDIKKALKDVDEATQGRWVMFIVTPPEARSAKNQIDKMPGYEVGIEQSTVEGQTFLYVRKT